jgi:uncharacterized repeat protein (TIGR01451 family)
MSLPKILIPPSLRPLRAAALILGAVALTASSALASTAANTAITNTATVNFNDAGGVAQPAVSASVTVTVSLVPAAVTLSSPGPQTIAQGGANASLTYTITSTANGPDNYNLTSVATPANVSGVSPTFPGGTPIALGGTTLAAPANNGDTSITVPYDNAGGAVVNGIGVGSTIIVASNPYTVTTVTKNVAANTTTIGIGAAIAGAALAGQIVGERKTFNVSVPSGTVSSGNSGTQTVNTTATSATAPNPATTQTTPTVITVNRPTLTVAKLVSTDGGISFGATGSAPPGTVLIYKIIATNSGSTSAGAVAFTDALPAYLTYQAGTGKFATAAATTYAAATALTEGSGGYSIAANTVTYNAGGGTGTVAGGGVLVLFFGAKIN